MGTSARPDVVYMMEDFFFKRKGRKYFVLTLSAFADGEVQMNVTDIIGGPFQIDFVEIHSLRFASIKSTLNSTTSQFQQQLVSPVEKHAFKVRVVGNYFLHKCRDLVQLRDIKDLCGNLALVLICEFIELFLSTSNSNNMSSRLSILLSKRKTNP
jgi:hypothetical protein